MQNKEIYQKVEELIEENKTAEDSKSDGVFILAIYKKGKKSESKVMMNGFSLKEADVIVRGVYGKIYELRRRGDKKMQEINKKLER